MKVLMIHHGRGIGGAPKSMSYLARALEKNNLVKTEILFLQKSSALQLFEGIKLKKHISRFPIYYFYHMSKWVRIWQIHKLLFQFISFWFHLLFISPYYLLKIKPDVVYLNSSVLPEWLLVAKLFKKRVVVHVRESISHGHFGLRRRFLKTIFSFADTVIFISNDNARRLLMENAPNSRIIYNYTSVDGNCCCVNKAFDFIYLGGDESIKGWRFIQELIRSELPCRLCLIGNYSEKTRQWLSKFATVHCLGVVANPEEYICQSKFLLSPFLEPHFSRPIIEAYSVGTVPVSSNLSGIEEQILNNSTGFLFDPSECRGLTRCCAKVLKLDESNYRTVVESGYFHYIENFTNKNEVKIIREILGSCYGEQN